MNNTFATADLHLFHEMLLTTNYRKFETLDNMHDCIITNWNKTVSKNDMTYILGDITLKGITFIYELIDIMRSLNGQKIIIRGNHDNQAVLDKLIETKEITRVIGIYDYKMISYNKKKVFLSHYPTLVWPERQHGAYHLYGHVHGRLDLVKDMPEKSLCVCLDEHNFTPFNLETAITL